MIKVINKLQQVEILGWKLSQNENFASYPRIKSKEEFENCIEKAIKEDHENIIGYFHKNVLCGICSYFWVSDVKYAQTKLFLIGEDYEKIAGEFINYIGEELAGYQLLIGVPFANKNANEYFKKNEVQCIDSSVDTRLYNLKIRENNPQLYIEKITEETFKEYALFHDRYAISLEMYYNSENLQKDIEKFRIFVFRKDGEIHGSIFVKLFKDGAEIFGLFLEERSKSKGIENILIKGMLSGLNSELSTVKEVVYFINENSYDELKAALDAGFEIEDKYRCYKYKL